MTEILRAVENMAEIVPFFPKGERAQAMISELIGQFVNTREELDWLTLTACGHIRDWEKSGGIAELRGLFCSRFRPADGIGAYSRTPGFTAEDFEAQFQSQQIEENSARFEAYRREALNAPAEDRKAFPLPKPKMVRS